MRLQKSQLRPILVDWRNETLYRLKYDQSLITGEKEILQSIIDHLDKIDSVCKKRGKY